MSQASKYGAGENPFPTERKHDPNAPAGIAYYRRAKCSKCGMRKYWRDNTPSGAAVPAIVSAFRKKGWEMNDRGRGICPDCLAPRKKEKVTLSDLGTVMNQTNQAKDYLSVQPIVIQQNSHPYVPPVPTEQPVTPTFYSANRPDKYVRATMQTALLIRDQLVSVVEKHADGYTRYREGFSDQIVAEAVAVACGHPVSPHSVAKLRRDLYGNMKLAPVPKSEPKTITVTVDPNPELLATLAAARTTLQSTRDEFVALAQMAMDAANNCNLQITAMEISMKKEAK